MKPQKVATARGQCPAVYGLRLRRKESGPPGLSECGGLLQTSHTQHAGRACSMNPDPGGHLMVNASGMDRNLHGGNVPMFDT